jgi:hypothetical protein
MKFLGDSDFFFRNNLYIDTLAHIASKNANGDVKEANRLFNEYKQLATTDEKSLEARQEALSLAVTMATKRLEITDEAVITLANLFEGYLIGDAELPELPEDTNALFKDYLSQMTNAIRGTQGEALGIGGSCITS